MNVTQLLNGVSLGALYTILASGLALVYGLRGVMNLSHGALYMLGAYLSYEFASATNFWLALLLAPLCLGVAGAVLELAVLRPLQHRGLLELALITLGIGFILESTIVTIWGRQNLTVTAPFSGSTDLLGVTYPSYRLFLIACGIGLTALMMLWLKLSRVGMYVQAASLDHETTAMMGVNVDRLSTIVVALSACFAGIAGVLASAYLAVEPGMGSDILVTALIVVVIGGLGSVGGAIVAALALGMLQAVGSVYLPEFSALVPYVALVAVLVWRPMGLAGTRSH